MTMPHYRLVRKWSANTKVTLYIIDNKGWKRRCPGGCPGFQNRRVAGFPVTGGFDPHSLPPFVLNKLNVHRADLRVRPRRHNRAADDARRYTSAVKDVGQGVALHDERGGIIVQDHVHPSEGAGGGVLFLAVQRHDFAGLVTHFQEQRTRTASRVVNGGGAGRSRVANAQNMRNDAADLGGV